MSRVHDEEARVVAEQAAEWLHRLPMTALRDRQSLLTWLRKSPLHVRELLAALAWDDELRHLDPQRRIDVDAFVEMANKNVISGAQQSSTGC